MIRYGRASIIAFAGQLLITAVARSLLAGATGLYPWVRTTLERTVQFTVLLVIIGLTFSIIGLCKGEKPRKYCVIGFILNILWPLLIVVGFSMELL